MVVRLLARNFLKCVNPLRILYQRKPLLKDLKPEHDQNNNSSLMLYIYIYIYPPACIYIYIYIYLYVIDLIKE